jgi:hypothetical protein
MDNGRVSHCLSVVKCRERSLRGSVYTCDRIGTTYVNLGGNNYRKQMAGVRQMESRSYQDRGSEVGWKITEYHKLGEDA